LARCGGSWGRSQENNPVKTGASYLVQVFLDVRFACLYFNGDCLSRFFCQKIDSAVPETGQWKNTDSFTLGSLGNLLVVLLQAIVLCHSEEPDDIPV